MTVPGVKRIRKTTRQTQICRNNKKAEDFNKATAFKRCTTWYAAEKLKPKGLSARKVVESVNEDYGTNIPVRTVQRYVKEGTVGISPQKKGPAPGFLPKETFAILLDAFESFIQINQINANADDNVLAKLNTTIHETIGLHSASNSRSLLHQLLSKTKVNWTARSIPAVEERRVRWTTHDNIKMWFDNWKRILHEHEFGFMRGDKFVIPPAQLRRIINLDESCLSLDGSTKVRGGRPGASAFDSALPIIGQPANKANVSITLITGSSAFGEPLPPHFQFPTKEKTAERERLPFETVRHFKSIRAAFGHRDVFNAYLERNWPVTMGMNEKGGMDDDEFYKFITTSICPLFPDVADENGRRVVIKIDSGPGRTNNDLLVRLRTLGFLLFPCIPNTTAVTQETDQAYGFFKLKYRANLRKLTNDRLARKLVGVPMTLIGILVFGGVDPETGCVYDDAFNMAFNKEKNVSSWGAVGAAPFTMACLTNSLVRHTMTETDPHSDLYNEIQDRNVLACGLLSLKGFDGNKLSRVIKESMPKAGVTVRHSKERIELLAKASTHGEKFFATGSICIVLCMYMMCTTSRSIILYVCVYIYIYYNTARTTISIIQYIMTTRIIPPASSIMHVLCIILYAYSS